MSAITWISWSGRIGGLLLMAAIASPAVLTAQHSEQAIRVRIYDYTGLSAPTLAQAKAVGSYVLGQAGVRLEWAECRIHQDDPPRDPACRLPVTRMDLQLRIIDASMAEHTGKKRDCLGYAVLTGKFDSIASVFAHHALELEQRNLANRAAILGAIMAHEIGHLLLGQSRHSGSGIMRTQWGDEELKLIAKGRLWFTAEEASRLVSMVAKRQRVGRITGRQNG